MTMVAKLSIGKKGYEEFQDDFVSVKDALVVTREKFLGLVDEDAESFKQVLKAFKLPKMTEADKQKRSEAVSEALKGAAEVPFKTMTMALEALKLSRPIVEHGNASSVSDAGVGTMNLNTKRQKKLLENDKVERELVSKYGGSVLLGEENADFSEFKLDRDVTTIGKAKFVHIKVKGFWISPIQAKITKENNCHVLTNLGKKGKTLVNGEPVTMCNLKNGDLLTVGRSTFKYVEGNA